MLACNRVAAITLEARSLPVSDPFVCEAAVRSIRILRKIEYHCGRRFPDAPCPRPRISARCPENPRWDPPDSRPASPVSSSVHPPASAELVPALSFRSSAATGLADHCKSRRPVETGLRGAGRSCLIVDPAGCHARSFELHGDCVDTDAGVRLDSARSLLGLERGETLLGKSRARLLDQARQQPGILDQSAAGTPADARYRPASRPGGKPGGLSPAPVPARGQQWTNQRAEAAARDISIASSRPPPCGGFRTQSAASPWRDCGLHLGRWAPTEHRCDAPGGERRGRDTPALGREGGSRSAHSLSSIGVCGARAAKATRISRAACCC